MRAVTREPVERGFTHYIIDVFESDPHSPRGFNTRDMRFAPVKSHKRGELACRSRRIIPDPGFQGRVPTVQGAAQLDLLLPHLRLGRGAAQPIGGLGPVGLVEIMAREYDFKAILFRF